jgi:cyclic pyranopterin phosphate synthase
MLHDVLHRPLRNLRLSVTDRCNIRCQYCMPEKEYVWLPKNDILHFEEVSQLVDVFAQLGVDKVRLTGGEPLLRRDLPELVRALAVKPPIKDLALTTNGILLAEQAEALRHAGLHRITVSLDTLHPDRFEALTRSRALHQVREGISAAAPLFPSLKLDTVVIRGVNDDELVVLIEYAKEIGAEIRFIEYMDVGGATDWSMTKVVPRQEMLERLTRHYGPIEPVVEETSAPADRFRLADGTVFGVISSTTEPFCRDCDRSRLTADGVWYLCLYAPEGMDLRGPLRAGATEAELKTLLTARWKARDDRGAEERLSVRNRSPLIPLSSLKKDPHLEMHTRGG